MSQATLHDVARLAGVSHTTVSWALRGDQRISPQTTARVLEAARELGYVANEAARCLVKGQSFTIAIVSASFSSSYESETLRGIETAMYRDHTAYSLVQYSTAGDEKRADTIYRQLLQSNRADAVISLCDPPHAHIREAYRQAKRPLVIFDEEIDDTITVRGDSKLGTELAFARLYERGVRRPLIMAAGACSDDVPACNPSRQERFTELCQEHGLPCMVHPIYHYTFEEGQEAATDIVQQMPDGIFCAAGDMVAIGLMAGLRARKVHIPEQIAIIGYDNLLVSSMVHPALSTVGQPLEQMGQEAVRLCFSLLKTGHAEKVQPSVFLPELFIRASG